jgi:hypothetical protein
MVWSIQILSEMTRNAKVIEHSSKGFSSHVAWILQVYEMQTKSYDEEGVGEKKDGGVIYLTLTRRASRQTQGHTRTPLIIFET